MDKIYNIDLSGFTIEGARILFNDKVLFDFPTPICEIARLDNSLFVILHPQNGSRDPEFSGTNLWALDLTGKILWKAPNLNDKYPKVQDGAIFHYSLLRIFDDANPKLRCYADDRWFPTLEAETGKNIDMFGKIDWSNMGAALERVRATEQKIEKITFVQAVRLCPTIGADAFTKSLIRHSLG